MMSRMDGQTYNPMTKPLRSSSHKKGGLQLDLTGHFATIIKIEHVSNSAHL